MSGTLGSCSILVQWFLVDNLHDKNHGHKKSGKIIERSMEREIIKTFGNKIAALYMVSHCAKLGSTFNFNVICFDKG